MALGKDLCGILAVGEQKERAARDFYLDAAKRTKHPLGRRMFERLAGEETKHERLLQDWANQGVCPVDVKFPPVDKEFLAKGKAKIAKGVEAETGDLAAVELAQEMERKAIAFKRTGTPFSRRRSNPFMQARNDPGARETRS